ncbi:MAG: FAD-dependent oxidoreductase [Lachnospiraceae bacterium]
MRIIIIGAVAAGTSAAAKARRNLPEAEIVIYEKGPDISYSGCGMPYFLGGSVKSIQELAPRDPAFFWDKSKIDIKTLHEVLEVNAVTKSVKIRDLQSGLEFMDHYDKLVLATGAEAVIPNIPGVGLPHVFSLRNMQNAREIDSYRKENHPTKAVILGTGFIGMELCENLKELGMHITLIEKKAQVMPNLDPEMSKLIESYLLSKGIDILTGRGVAKIESNYILLESCEKVEADLVILAVGIRPDIRLALQIGAEIGVTGAIKVDPLMHTSIPDVYSCGDCIEQFQLLSNRPVYRPLGSTANKTGRICGDSLADIDVPFRGILGTGIFRLFDMTVASTGLSEQEVSELGIEFTSVLLREYDKPEYMGGKTMTIKAIADKSNGTLLGVQIFGPEGVDKRLDIFVTAMTFGAKAEDLFHLDLAYAPPYSLAKDAVMLTGMVLEKRLD